jgi:hypothetical protein
VLLEEPQDIVGVFQRERVNDQPADPEFRVTAGRARVDGHRVQLEVGDLQRAEPGRPLDLGGGPLQLVEAPDQVVGAAVAEGLRWGRITTAVPSSIVSVQAAT